MRGWWHVLKLPKLVSSAFFLRVLIEISYDLWTFGIPKAFREGDGWVLFDEKPGK
jgi:hypothetical protein